MDRLMIEEIEIEVTKKKIKNLYIRILPPDGRVCISAPYRMSLTDIKRFASGKLSWIRSHKEKYLYHSPQAELSYVSGESIFFQGEKYVLEVIYAKRNHVQLDNGKLLLTVKDSSSKEQRERVLIEWYRKMLKQEIPHLLEKWQKTIGVNTSGWGVKNMKTRWGTCNIRSRHIWLSLRLAQMPPACLEYVVVHELVHLLEKSHNKVFYGYMDIFLPNWRTLRKEMKP